METKINLLKRAQTSRFIEKKVRRKITLIAIISAVVFGIISISLFFFNLYISAKIKAVNQKIKTQEVKISSFSEVEAINFLISDRVSSLGKILAQDKKFDEKLEKIRGTVPSEVLISQIVLSEASFSLAVTAPKLSLLNQLITNLISPELGGKYFARLVLEGLGIDEKGMYSLSLTGEVL